MQEGRGGEGREGGKYGNPMQEGRGEKGVNDHPIRQGSKQK